MTDYKNNLAVRFKKVVDSYGSRPALLFEEGRAISYAQLDHRSNQVARFLQGKGIGRGDRVCINLDKTVAPYCIIFACLKIGAVYFATDPKNPAKRIEKIFEQCPPSLIFSGADLDLDSWHEKTIVCPETYDKLDFCEDLDPGPLDLPDPVKPSDPAYIMFTSGSTGLPKGAVMTHANLSLFIDWAIAEYDLVPQDIHTHINPIYFDNSVFDMYSTFFSGGALVPFKTDLLQDPQGVVRRIEQFGCTVFFSVPSMLIFLQSLKAIDARALASLKKIIFGGEGYPKIKLKQLYEELGQQTQLINVYGPTECTCICSSYLIDSSDFENLDGYPPIGDMTANFSYYLLDGNREVAPGEVGELCLGGPCVGLGYFNQIELTQKVFVQNPVNDKFAEKIYRTGDLLRFNPDDGKLWFVGRKDFQIKHQGHRIELEEIEHALAAIAGIDEAVALHNIEEGISKIIGIVASREVLNPGAIRSQLTEIIPKYMVPNKVHIIERMPKNANGKTDRKKLRESYLASS